MYYKVTYIISLKEFSRNLASIASGTCVDQHNDGTAEVSFSTRHCCSYGRANVPVDTIKGTWQSQECTDPFIVLKGRTPTNHILMAYPKDKQTNIKDVAALC